MEVSPNNASYLSVSPSLNFIIQETAQPTTKMPIVQFEQVLPNIGLNQNAMKEVAEILVRLDADEFMLKSTTYFCKQNVLGHRTKVLRDLFE